eukprot:scaffold137764_cov30-Prasinocladus_malaysianus.AAC.1
MPPEMSGQKHCMPNDRYFPTGKQGRCARIDVQKPSSRSQAPPPPKGHSALRDSFCAACQCTALQM